MRSGVRVRRHRRAEPRLDKAAAEAIAEIFTEVVIAPEADEDAVAVFAKKKNLRLLVTGGLPDPSAPGLSYKTIAGGFLAQNRDNRPHQRAPI